MTTAETLASDLTGAVERGEIVAYYQPQVDIDSLDVVGVEALARWMHPQFGLIPPSIFIPLAEAFTVIHEIGDFMLDEGIRRARQWSDLGLDIAVAINVSPLQLSNLAFLDRLQDGIDAEGVPAENFVIEITESVPVVMVEAVTAQLLQLKEAGLGISIDDFGSGFSSFAQLAGIPATEIKIDRSLIHDPGSVDLILNGIIVEAHEQGIRVVAEGIENDQHLTTARALKCDRAQGFLFGRAEPEKTLTPRLLESADE